MIKNRMKRIALPFIVFLLLLHPLIILALDFTAVSFGTSLSEISTSLTYLPLITYHLWFLYYLIFLTVFSWVVALLLKRMPRVTTMINTFYKRLLHRQFGAIATFSLLLFIVMLYIWDYGVPTPISFVPDFGAFLFFILFYGVGWILYSSKQSLLIFTRHAWPLTLSALLIYTIRFVWASYIDDVLIGIIHAVITWMFVFGITGLFIRYTSQPNSRMRYISDSSYWVFLIHLPFTILIPGLMVNWALPAIIKFLITLAGTTIVCLTTYHYLVRSSWIGQFLNGRKFSN